MNFEHIKSLIDADALELGYDAIFYTDVMADKTEITLLQDHESPLKYSVPSLTTFVAEVEKELPEFADAVVDAAWHVLNDKYCLSL